MNTQQILDRVQGMEARLVEDEIYRMVWEEIEVGQLDPVSKARAMVEGANDETELRSAYIRHRVRRLKDELDVAEANRARVEKETVAILAQHEKTKAAEERASRNNARSRAAGAFIGSTIVSLFSSIAASGILVALLLWLSSIMDISDSSLARDSIGILFVLIWFVLLPFIWIKTYNMQINMPESLEKSGNAPPPQLPPFH